MPAQSAEERSCLAELLVHLLGHAERHRVGKEAQGVQLMPQGEHLLTGRARLQVKDSQGWPLSTEAL